MPDDEESGGLKFAITLLAAFGTIILASYSYFQNNAVDNNFYVVIVGVILSLLLSSIFLIGYVFVKGYSMEVHETARTHWENIASDIYSIAFEVGAMVLLSIIGIFLSMIYLNFIVAIVFLFVVVFLYLFFDELKSCFLKFLDRLRLQLNLKKVTVLLIMLIFLVVWATLFTSMFGFIQGRVTIDMNSIYNKNETIPIYIEVTGRNDNAKIELYQLNFTNPIETFELGTEFNSSKNLNRENSTLIGNTFYFGKYYVFINTTELREGYYELTYTRQKDGYKYGKSFYLLNASR